MTYALDPDELDFPRTMSYIDVQTSFPELKDKVVIVTGGSSGIGLSTVQLFRKSGAKVMNGDLNPPPSHPSTPPNQSELEFCQTDVTNWTSLSNLFSRTFELYGRIDIVFANAGIREKGDMFLDQYDDEGRLKEPSYEVLDINLRAVLNTTKLATHYFAKQSPVGGKLIITGSFAAYFGEPIPVYTAAKHGTLGFVRSISSTAPKFNVTVNLICPWIANSPWLIPALEEMVTKHGIPITDISNVARAVAYVACSDWNGKAMFVAGQKFIELENGIDATRKQWLGEEFDELVGRRHLYGDQMRQGSGW